MDKAPPQTRLESQETTLRPIRLLSLVAAAVFVAEAVVMALLFFVPREMWGVWVVLDPLLLLAVLAPALYRWLYLPMRRDVLEQRRAAAELRMAASVFHSTVEGISVTDADAVILAVNPAFTAITQYSAEEAIGHKPSLLKSDHHDAAFYRDMWEQLLSSGSWQGEIWNRRKNGEAYLEWLSISMIPDEEGKPHRYVAVFSDLTEIHARDEHIKHQTFHDALTGLPNRRLFQVRLEHEVEIARREGTSLALMLLDLDRFRVVNDSLGHDVGDRLLEAIGSRLSNGARQTDTVARLGGDEFVFILKSVAEGMEVAPFAEEILHLVAAPVEISGHDIHPSGSLGISVFPLDGEDAISLTRQADMAMYRAKADGGGTFRYADPSLNRRAGERLDLEAHLRRALEKGELEMFYQPKLRIADETFFCAEALIRWRHPERGLVSPGDFIPLAEETGLILPIGEWAFAEVCRQIVRWRAKGLKVERVAVNLSARQFRDAQLVERIKWALVETGAEPASIELELTESTLMTDEKGGVSALRALAALGIHLSIDDFGTGYSSLAYLRRLPISSIKIDRCFIANAEASSEDASIVRTVIALARSLDLEVIAEGVETRGQLDFLKAHGCTHAQGYFCAKPMPAAEFEEVVLMRGNGQARVQPRILGM